VKYKNILLACLFVIALLSLSCAPFVQQSYLDAQDATYKMVRQNIANPSVFTIHTSGKIIFTEKVADKDAKPQVATVSCGGGIGEGFVIAPDGHALTVTHVTDLSREYIECFAKAKEIMAENKVNIDDFTAQNIVKYEATFASGENMPFEVMKSASPAAEKDTTLIMLHPEKPKVFQPIIFSSATDLSDQSIAVIGSPFGTSNIVASGKIARTEPMGKTDRMIIIAAIYPGNSGGPAVSLHDMKVVGMVDAVQIADGTITNIATMIPSSSILFFLHEVLPGYGF